MTRYRKSIHRSIQEVAEWEAPKEPEPEGVVEEAPIPTETGRELLKKRIAHKKEGKKEIKYYPMGDTFKNKLHKTTQHLKEALEIDDELDEAVKWEVKVTGLPVFYSDGKSKGAVRQMLRKLLKHPDDIISITRTTSAELKKIRRGQIAGDEPGEDEDKNPVGANYNEANLPPHLAKFVDKKGNLKPDAAKRVAAGRKKKPSHTVKDVTPKGYGPDEAFEGPFSAPGSGSIARPRKGKDAGVDKSIEDQMAAARKENLAFQEDEWNTMWKNAAKSKPKMSFKQAMDFVDEVDLPKKEKKEALKKAKKWLR